MTISWRILVIILCITACPIFAEFSSETWSNEHRDCSDDVYRKRNLGQWAFVECSNVISLNFADNAFDTTLAAQIGKYSVKFKDETVVVLSVSIRYHVDFVPHTQKELITIYRVYLTLGDTLINQNNYTISIENIGLTTSVSQMSVIYNENGNINGNIKVNQVGYLRDQKKIGYVGKYLGTGGGMVIPNNASTYMILDTHGNIVQTFSNGVMVRENDPHTGENIHVLDFSDFRQDGQYQLYIPHVGLSLPFEISETIYNQVFGNAMQGCYHARCGIDIGMPFTRHERLSGHTNDAYLMPHDPVPDFWKSYKGGAFISNLYSTTLEGNSKMNTSHGHHDAGDYGKYTWNAGHFVGNLLSAFEASIIDKSIWNGIYSDQTGLPTSNNNMPDLLDEIIYELEWLENIQDQGDGGVFCIVKPDGFAYQSTMPGDQDPKRVVYPKDTTCTGVFAAALAKAARSSVLAQYVSTETRSRWLEKAKFAWSWLESNPGYLCWHHYGCSDDYSTDKSHDDRVWAALELYLATGTESYHEYFLNNHAPEYKKWGWVRQPFSYGIATKTYALAKWSQNEVELNYTMWYRCRSVVLESANSALSDSQNRAYGLPMEMSPLNYGSFGWWFPQNIAHQLSIAITLSHGEGNYDTNEYKETMLRALDFILGCNPNNMMYITGIGSKRLREAVDQESLYDGIAQPVPGIPIGLASSPSYISWYGSSASAKYPASYPLLSLSFDGWNTNAEFTVDILAQHLLVTSFFAIDTRDSSRPIVKSICAYPTEGPIPLSVSMAADMDGISSDFIFYWDFDDDSYSIQSNPEHIFHIPGKTYKVTLAVTNRNNGIVTYITQDIKTRPSHYTFLPYSVESDSHTLLLYNLDGDFSDSSGNGNNGTMINNPKFSTDNMQWMIRPSGSAVRFSNANEFITGTIPVQEAFPSPDSVLSFDAMINIEEYVAYSISNNYCFSIYGSWNRYFALWDPKWGPSKTKIVLCSECTGESAATTLITDPYLDGNITLKEWHHVFFVIGNSSSFVYVDGVQIASAIGQTPLFENMNSGSIEFRIGGFKGYVDEMRVKTSVNWAEIATIVTIPVPIPIERELIVSGSCLSGAGGNDNTLDSPPFSELVLYSLIGGGGGMLVVIVSIVAYIVVRRKRKRLGGKESISLPIRL